MLSTRRFIAPGSIYRRRPTTCRSFVAASPGLHCPAPIRAACSTAAPPSCLLRHHVPFQALASSTVRLIASHGKRLSSNSTLSQHDNLKSPVAASRDSQNEYAQLLRDTPKDDTDSASRRVRRHHDGIQGPSTAAEDCIEKPGPAPFLTRFRPSRQYLKRTRKSRPEMVLDSIPSDIRDLYTPTQSDRKDNSHVFHSRREPPGLEQTCPPQVNRFAEPPSLYNILAKHIENVTQHPPQESRLSLAELSFLRSKGYAERDVHCWADSLLATGSMSAADLFSPDRNMPPFFLILLFLRRKRIRAAALGVVMRHLELRVDATSPIEWNSLKILMVRLIHHARSVWPESMPWIARFFCSEAGRVFDGKKAPAVTIFLSDLTDFCNSLLSLLSLPASVYPVLSAQGQETAQFEVLQFMASQSPPLLVTRIGFRSLAKTQLAHPKTSREGDWAELKRASWPPWKQNRNAMDEDKDYLYGSSRASSIIQRMSQAGYAPGALDRFFEIYAGWDTDLSPTIQTRKSLLPHFRHGRTIIQLQWAARIEATRTRREAWSCFLAYEASKKARKDTSEDVYIAMFEKLRLPEVTPSSNQESAPANRKLQAGDAKEPLPDASSPLDLAYINEPVPTYEQLYHRMTIKGIKITNTLLVYLVGTSPDFDIALETLEHAKHCFDGGVGALLDGSYVQGPKDQVPIFVLDAFIHCLCRFGRLSQHWSLEPMEISVEHHRDRMFDRNYLVRYAHALLLHSLPAHRPSWTAYMGKVIFSNFHEKTAQHAQQTHWPIVQWRTLGFIISTLRKLDLEIEDVQFRHMCHAARFTAQKAIQGALTRQDSDYFFSTAGPVLRSLFHELVCMPSAPDSPSVTHGTEGPTPHVPPPAILHAYIRALGMLHEFEALYSLASWMQTYNAEIMARAEQKKGGPEMVFRSLVALRSAMEGQLDDNAQAAPEELQVLVRAQVEGVEGWWWPSDEDVQMYRKGTMRSGATPAVGSVVQNGN
ncbi:hypothetical protein BS50DRAFT_559865 [Corynespora cassiicola Philippines]|uniref:Uncharacterized protein n=1 Tax=Corynespora cassiicola Philippines TaxID=1448308 RepID=A0A2T2NAG9_CORCC|nr:hypothetical protein BS50DRAFT_559865 [Corynespora cassiicola Philippines]